MTVYIDCVNCGRQVIIETNDLNETCYFCGKPARRKISEEVKEVSTQTPTPQPPVPPKPELTGIKQKDRRLMHQYYLDNLGAIRRDLAELGQKKTMERWGITSGSTISKIRHGWKGRKPRKKPVSKLRGPRSQTEPPKLPSATKVSKGNRVSADGLPAFPEFDSSWPEMVQIRWLDKYCELARAK